MKYICIKFIFSLVSISIFASCSNSETTKLKGAVAEDSIKPKTVDLNISGSKEGVIGVFDVPEMLTICKLDSAPMKDVSFKVAKNYSLLEEEMNAIEAKLDGSPGMITYTNDTNNFVFECVLPIKDLPKKQPKKCKIVVLEASQMVLYNFYGPYQNLYSAYNKIRDYNEANKLEQSGPMREFYLSDPTVEKDPNKWQTRIMVPVKKLK